MPARSDETEREALLASAARTWEAVASQPGGDEAAAGLTGVGGALGFLREYYRLIATEDLTLAGPDRIAAVAARHAALGAARPQGRAMVAVRRAAQALTDATTVVDIVTDDMPYLVDSVTMEAQLALRRRHDNRAPVADRPPGRGRHGVRHRRVRVRVRGAG